VSGARRTAGCPRAVRPSPVSTSRQVSAQVAEQRAIFVGPPRAVEGEGGSESTWQPWDSHGGHDDAIHAARAALRLCRARVGGNVFRRVRTATRSSPSSTSRPSTGSIFAPQNVIESPFATVRLRQRVTKGGGSRTKGPPDGLQAPRRGAGPLATPRRQSNDPHAPRARISSTDPRATPTPTRWRRDEGRGVEVQVCPSVRDRTTSMRSCSSSPRAGRGAFPRALTDWLLSYGICVSQPPSHPASP
jgi:hypothetical protein